LLANILKAIIKGSQIGWPCNRSWTCWRYLKARVSVQQKFFEGAVFWIKSKQWVFPRYIRNSNRMDKYC